MEYHGGTAGMGASGAARSSFMERMIGAATLNVPTYEEVEHDRTATGQAAGVVALVAVASAIGSIAQAGSVGVIVGLLGAFIGWFIWAALTLFIGTKLFDGTSDMGEMLRALGFAQSAGVLYVLGVVPVLGTLAKLVVGIWVLVCGVVAVRQALDFTTGKAIATVVIGWLVYVVVGTFLGLLFTGFNFM